LPNYCPKTASGQTQYYFQGVCLVVGAACPGVPNTVVALDPAVGLGLDCVCDSGYVMVSGTCWSLGGPCPPGVPILYGPNPVEGYAAKGSPLSRLILSYDGTGKAQCLNVFILCGKTGIYVDKYTGFCTGVCVT